MMRKIFLAFAFLISSPAIAHDLRPNEDGSYDLRVIRVLDGDTVEIDAPFLPVELKQVLKLRILGVDTPEKGFRAKCEKESKMAELATDFTRSMVFGATTHRVLLKQWDKYGGRVLGDLFLDDVSLKELLIDNGYAVPYNGEKKPNWCK